jgi:Double zinc ribbon
MAKTCSGCRTENPDESAFCGNCGESLSGEAQSEGEPVRVCASCESEIPNSAAVFCPSCGASVEDKTGLALPSKRVMLGGGGVVAAIVVVLVGFVLLSGGGGGETSNIFADLDPAPLSDAAADAFALALADLPDPVGDTEAEMLQSLLGQPDVFVLQFEEPEGGGPRQRFETWYYLDLGMSYDFLDGALLYAFPIQEPAPLTLIPLRFSPFDFTAETTLDDLRAMMFDPDSLKAEQPPEEYGTTIPVWAGEQLMAMFDEQGALFYVETIPLVPDE